MQAGQEHSLQHSFLHTKSMKGCWCWLTFPLHSSYGSMVTQQLSHFFIHTSKWLHNHWGCEVWLKAFPLESEWPSKDSPNLRTHGPRFTLLWGVGKEDKNWGAATEENQMAHSSGCCITYSGYWINTPDIHCFSIPSHQLIRYYFCPPFHSFPYFTITVSYISHLCLPSEDSVWVYRNFFSLVPSHGSPL